MTEIKRYHCPWCGSPMKRAGNYYECSSCRFACLQECFDFNASELLYCDDPANYPAKMGDDKR